MIYSLNDMKSSIFEHGRINKWIKCTSYILYTNSITKTMTYINIYQFPTKKKKKNEFEF